ncbi:hypothetical protein CEW92_08485 [Bacillaceae bacterium SAS-127]|nr:hypothetical protein CEW92_08485 [Bacillaceae bacterium SAS-127]
MEMTINPFVQFMEQYDVTTADNSKIFDEHTSNVEYSIQTNINDSIINIFKSQPKSVVITGNAGDGKTRICRNVYEALTGKLFEAWDPVGIEKCHYQDYEVRIIKDLSELRDEVINQELLNLQHVIENNERVYYLIAANEGKLTYALSQNTQLATLKTMITQQFLIGHTADMSRLQVFNLLHTSSSVIARNILEEWNKEEHWGVCTGCIKNHQCIIYHNHNKLKDKPVNVRVNRLYRSLDTIQSHMTMRELLIHMAYMHLGGLNCEDIHKADAPALKEQSKRVYYENFFGHTLPNDEFADIAGIQDLKSFDPGFISDTLIDDFIFSGDLLGDTLAIIHEEMYGDSIDTEYGYFLHILKKYRQNYQSDQNNGLELVDNWMPRLRRKYFFEFNKVKNVERLVLFKNRQLFLNILSKPELLDSSLKMDLVNGLNNYFAKQMIYSPTATLYVVSEKLYVYNCINFADIEFCVPKGEAKLDRKNAFFEIKIKQATLKVNLVVFEYLLRIAYGGMLSVFKEDVEILLNNFKNKLINTNHSGESVVRMLKYHSSEAAYVLKEIQFRSVQSTEQFEEDFD